MDYLTLLDPYSRTLYALVSLVKERTPTEDCLSLASVISNQVRPLYESSTENNAIAQAIVSLVTNYEIPLKDKQEFRRLYEKALRLSVDSNSSVFRMQKLFESICEKATASERSQIIKLAESRDYLFEFPEWQAAADDFNSISKTLFKSRKNQTTATAAFVR